MLEYKLIKKTETEQHYEYRPEGKGRAGVVAYNKETGKCRIVVLSEDDELKLYALKMFKRMRENIPGGNMKAEGRIAWA